MFGFPWVTPASMIPWYIDSCSVSLDSDRYKSNCTVSPGFFSALSILNTVLWALNSGLKRSFKSTWIVSGCSWLYLMQSFLGRKQVMQNICLQVFFHPRCINHQGFLGTETGHQRTHFERNPMGIPTGRHLMGFPWINEVELFHPHGRRLAIWQLRAVFQRFPKRGLSWRHVVPTNRGRRPR